MYRQLHDLVILLCVMCFLLAPVPITVFAETADELQQKINVRNEELKKLSEEITTYRTEINDLGTQKNTLKTTIRILDTTKKKLETDIKVTQTKVDTTDLTIRKLNSEISYKENEVRARITALRESVLRIYESEKASLPQIALSYESFSGLWDDLEHLEQFNDAVNRDILEIKLLKSDLEKKSGTKQQEKNKLVDFKSELADQKKITENTKLQKTQILKQTSNKESLYQKTLREKLALKEQMEKELRDYESTLRFILDPTSIPPRGKKVFSSPLDSMHITQNFGKTNAKNSSGQRLYANGTHNGTDFRAAIGTPLRAMQNGVVAGVGDTDVTCSRASFGKWVLIRYQNGLASVYAHMSLVKAVEGQTVLAGDVVGYSGNSGYSTGPHLHVSVYASAGVKVENLPSRSCGGAVYRLPLAATNAYLDPMDYI